MLRTSYLSGGADGRKPVVWLKQPCTHPVQLHGLCGICGADLTS